LNQDTALNNFNSQMKKKKPDALTSQYANYMADMRKAVQELKPPRFLDPKFAGEDLAQLSKLYKSFFRDVFSKSAKQAQELFEDINKQLLLSHKAALGEYSKFVEASKKSQSEIQKAAKDDSKSKNNIEALATKSGLNAKSIGSLIAKSFKIVGITAAVSNTFDAIENLNKSLNETSLKLRKEMNQSASEFFDVTWKQFNASTQRLNRLAPGSVGDTFNVYEAMEAFSKTLNTGYTESQRAALTDLQAILTKVNANFDINSDLIQTATRVVGSDKILEVGELLASTMKQSMKAFSKEQQNISNKYLFRLSLMNREKIQISESLQKGAMAAGIFERSGIDQDFGMNLIKYTGYMGSGKRGLSNFAWRKIMSDPKMAEVLHGSYNGDLQTAMADAQYNPQAMANNIKSWLSNLDDIRLENILGPKGAEDFLVNGMLNSKDEEQRIQKDQLTAIQTTNQKIDDVNKGLVIVSSWQEQISNFLSNQLSYKGVIPSVLSLQHVSGIAFGSTIVSLLESIKNTILMVFAPEFLGKLFSIFKGGSAAGEVLGGAGEAAAGGGFFAKAKALFGNAGARLAGSTIGRLGAAGAIGAAVGGATVGIYALSHDLSWDDMMSRWFDSKKEAEERQKQQNELVAMGYSKAFIGRLDQNQKELLLKKQTALNQTESLKALNSSSSYLEQISKDMKDMHIAQSRMSSANLNPNFHGSVIGVDASTNDVFSKWTGEQQSRAKIAYDYFRSQGLSPSVANGIIANLYHEHGFNTDDAKVQLLANGAEVGGLGIAQWNGARRQALFDYARQKGVAWNDYQLQLEFLIKEAKERGNFDSLLKLTSSTDAADYFARKFEVADSRYIPQRLATAKALAGVFEEGASGAYISKFDYDKLAAPTKNTNIDQTSAYDSSYYDSLFAKGTVLDYYVDEENSNTQVLNDSVNSLITSQVQQQQEVKNQYKNFSLKDAADMIVKAILNTSSKDSITDLQLAAEITASSRF
jgi:hypothetical protein